MHKKIIVSLCAVTLIGVLGASVKPAPAAHADNSVTTQRLSTTASTAETFSGTVDLVDVNGHVLGQTSHLEGHYGDHVTITLPTGYVAVSNGASSIDYILNKDRTPIKIRKIGDVDVVRTIRLHEPDGTIKRITQTAKAGQDFVKYTVPVLKYYKASESYIPAETAKAGRNKVIDITYKRSYPTWTEGVKGYDVVASGPITRTINFVDESGKKLAPSKVETVDREILVKKHNIGHAYPYRYRVISPDKTTTYSNLSPVTAQKDLSNSAIQKIRRAKVQGYIVLEVNGNRSNLVDPAYKLQDVTAPTIKGYTLKNKKLANISGQYLWLSNPESLGNNAKLSSGLDEYLTKDTTINVVYTKNGAKSVAAGQNQGNNSNGTSQSAQGQTTNNNQGSNGSTSNGNPANTGNSNGTTGSNGSGADNSTCALPQTGNKPANWLIMGFTSALSALGLGFLASRKHRA